MTIDDFLRGVGTLATVSGFAFALVSTAFWIMDIWERRKR